MPEHVQIVWSCRQLQFVLESAGYMNPVLSFSERILFFFPPGKHQQRLLATEQPSLLYLLSPLDIPSPNTARRECRLLSPFRTKMSIFSGRMGISVPWPSKRAEMPAATRPLFQRNADQTLPQEGTQQCRYLVLLKSHVDILIIGAGPAGFMASAWAGRYAISCRTGGRCIKLGSGFPLNSTLRKGNRESHLAT